MWFLVGVLILVPALLLGWAGWLSMAAALGMLSELLPILVAVLLVLPVLPFVWRGNPWKHGRALKRQVLASTLPPRP
jgi:hypothetical protein